MKTSELKLGEHYALGRGDIRDDPERFRRVEYVRRAPARYHDYNRNKQLNRGHVIVRFMDEPRNEPRPGRGSHLIVHDNRKKGSEQEVNPTIDLSWTWREFEKLMGEELQREASERAREKEVRTYFTELGIGDKHLNIGRNSLSYYHRDQLVSMMTSSRGNLDKIEVRLPFGILRKLVAGTELTEEDWKDE